MLNKIKKEPALSAALLSFIGSILSLFIHNPALVASLLGVATVFIGLRQVVTPVTTMTENVTKAATQAATNVAKTLGETTVGTVGEVTDTAKSIVNNVVNQTVGNILK